MWNLNINGNFATLKRNDHINTPTDVNCLNIIHRYILIYVMNIHNYFDDFRRFVKYATMKIDIARRKWSEFETLPNATIGLCVASHSINTKREAFRPLPDPLMGLKEGTGAMRGG
jgi:hypothetical protein